MPPPYKLDERIYANTLDGLLALIHAAADDIETLLVVGHNPSIADLAYLLDDDHQGPEHASLAEFSVLATMWKAGARSPIRFNCPAPNR